MLYINKQWDNIGITNNFIFIHVLQNKKIAKRILELFIGIKIKNIRVPDPEKYFDSMINTKSVRLDVYITDTDDNIYNIECQIKNESDDHLDLRDMYIHSILTVNNLFKGNDYNDLKYEYVIFICKFDFLRRVFLFTRLRDVNVSKIIL